MRRQFGKLASIKGLLALVMAFAVVANAAAALDMSPLKGVAWGKGTSTLVVILHGDSGPSSSYEKSAKTLASRLPNATVVALTRPAFTGPTGKSPGQNPQKDHFTSRNNKLLAESLQSMKSSLGAKKLVVIGHSGGAGQMGTVIGRFPGIVDVAILAACPCDVPNWRIHRRGKNNWKQSQSPHSFAKRIPKTTKVVLITGSADDNTLPRFAQRYAGIAQKSGADITFVVPQGVTHKFSSLRPYVHQYALELAR